MKSLRRSVLVAGAVLLTVLLAVLLGTTAGCGLVQRTSAVGTVQQGSVAKTLVAIGSVSSGSPSTPAAAIVQFYESRAALIRVGQPAVLTFEDMPGLRLDGVVASVVPIQSNIAQQIVYHAAINIRGDDGRLKPGQDVRASIAMRPVSNVLVVPNGAVRDEGTGIYVTSADGKRLAFTPGEVGDEVTEVRGGLSDGQQVQLR